MKRTALLIKQKLPSRDWLIKILSSINCEHEIFGKDYVKPREEKKQAFVPRINNPDDFFSNLPAVRSKGRALLCLTDKASKEKLRLDRLEAQLAKIQRQVQHQRSQVEGADGSQGMQRSQGLQQRR